MKWTCESMYFIRDMQQDIPYFLLVLRLTMQLHIQYTLHSLSQYTLYMYIQTNEERCFACWKYTSLHRPDFILFIKKTASPDYWTSTYVGDDWVLCCNRISMPSNIFKNINFVTYPILKTCVKLAEIEAGFIL